MSIGYETAATFHSKDPPHKRHVLAQCRSGEGFGEYHRVPPTNRRRHINPGTVKRGDIATPATVDTAA